MAPHPPRLGLLRLLQRQVLRGSEDASATGASASASSPSPAYLHADDPLQVSVGDGLTRLQRLQPPDEAVDLGEVRMAPVQLWQNTTENLSGPARLLTLTRKRGAPRPQVSAS